MTELEIKVLQHFKLYQEGKEIIPDSDYDKLVKQLKSENPNSDVFKVIEFKNIDTNKETNWEFLENKTKVKMAYPLGTLEKINQGDTSCKEDMESFLKEDVNMITPKYDGMALQIYYNNGTISYISTRGEDGVVGQNVSYLDLHVKTIPAKISYTEPLVVCGELVCQVKTFEEVFKIKGYKSIRAIVPGIINSEKKRELTRYFTFYPYDIKNVSMDSKKKLDLLKTLGFTFFEPIFFKGYKKFFDLSHEIYTCKEANTLQFPIDGLVIENFNSGRKIAYKFENKEIVGIIKEIHWKVGKTGNIIPTVELYETEYNGKTIKYASGHSYNNLIEKKIMPGAEVGLEMTGEVGIHVARVISVPTDTYNLQRPYNCPECNSLVTLEGANIKCTNIFCKGMLKSAISTHCLMIDIPDLGFERISTLVDNKILTKLIDLYETPMEKFKILGENMGEKIYKAIHTKRKVSIPKFIKSLGINFFGETAGQKLAMKYNNINKILCLNKNDISEFTAGAYLDRVYDEFNNNRLDYSKLLNYIEVEPYQFMSGNLSGKSFVVTGAFANVSREGLYDLIRKNGGTIKEKIKIKDECVDYLICDNDSNSSKNKQAKENNVPIISLQTFMEMINV